LAVFRAVLRAYSYLFHALLGLFLLGISLVVILSGTHDLHIKFLPWSGKQLTYAVFMLALIGLAAVILAIFGKVRLFFLIWSIAVLLFLLRGFFLSSYVFANAGDFRAALYFTLAALIAVVGAWFQFRPRRLRT
jgi:hypothetical protein